jgi:predicted TIM-barrel fold metal-dependent hydrolase
MARSLRTALHSAQRPGALPYQRRRPENTTLYLGLQEGADRRYFEASDQEDPLHRNDWWSFDSKLEAKRAFPSSQSGTSPESAELRDVEARLKHMDELGTDVQALYPTALLGLTTLSRPRTQIAMCRSYNRWMADIWRKGKGRLRWVATLLTMDAALEKLRFARENGGCGFLLQGLPGRPHTHRRILFPAKRGG